MRKLTYSVFALAAGSLFADTFQFTETESTIDTATIYYISGTNGVNEGTVLTTLRQTQARMRLFLKTSP